MGGHNSLWVRTVIVWVLSVHLIVLPTVVAYQQYNGCIFGYTADCYFECKCRSGTCDRLTGKCPQSDTCAEEDDLMLDYYPPEYSSGAACQVHNLAYEAYAKFSTNVLDEAIAVAPTRSNINHHFSTLTYDNAEEVLVIVLEEKSNIEFVEVLLHPNHDIADFTEHFKVSLDMEIKNVTTSDEQACTVTDRPFSLKSTIPNEIKTVHYTCASPSTAKVLKITPDTELVFPYALLLVRTVMVGHRYIDIDLLACLTDDGDDDFRWCKVCIGAYPPDCKRKCLTGYWGENCENTCSPDCSTGTCDAMNGACICQFGQCQSSTTENEASYQSTQTTVVVGLPTNKENDMKVNGTGSSEDGGGILSGDMLIVVISVGVAILVLVIVVVTSVLVCRKQHKKKRPSPHRLPPAIDEANRSTPPVRFTRNLPSVHAENDRYPSMYEEIPADHPNDHWQQSTSPEGQDMLLPIYCADPMRTGNNGQLSSQYMTTDQVTEVEPPYLEPRQLASRPAVASVDNNTSRSAGYEPLRERGTGHQYTGVL